MTTIIWTKIKGDINGNPRYVCHFLHLLTREELDNYDITSSQKYVIACKRANALGGRKFNTKKYGGGIVFQSYSIRETENSIADKLARDTVAVPKCAVWWSSSCGRVELQITPTDAAKGHHSGQCDTDIAKLRQVPYIAYQLARINPVSLQLEMREIFFDSDEDPECTNHENNLSRVLWIACGDIVEGN